jgi:hypothetical protein
MKTLLSFFLLPLQLFAQDVTGIWTGYIQTTESKLPYELIISEAKGKLGGYSLTVFTFNNVENIGIKSMKFKNKNEKISVEDDELLYNNFSSPPRKVKLLGELSLKTEGSTIILSGSFYTRSLDFRATNQNLFTGTIYLQKQDNNTQSKLVSQLDEMNLLGSLSFSVPTAKKQEQAAVTAPVDEIELPAQKEKLHQLSTTKAFVAKASPPVLKPALKEVPPPSIIYIASAEPGPAPVSEPKVLEKNIAAVQKELPPKNIQLASGSEQKTIVTHPAPSPEIAKTSTVTTKLLPAPVNAAVDIEKRKTEIIKSVPFTSDSLVLSLYDNGTIDGDTVSVVLNGNVIIAKKRLTTNAIRTTIQITPDMGDSLQLVMYAENLGSIPPNTGLLIIQDGEVRNEIRFAGDMQKSSAIILKRKR